MPQVSQGIGYDGNLDSLVPQCFDVVKRGFSPSLLRATFLLWATHTNYRSTFNCDYMINMVLSDDMLQSDRQKGPICATEYTTSKASQAASVKDFSSGIAILDKCRLRYKIVIKSANSINCQTYWQLLRVVS